MASKPPQCSPNYHLASDCLVITGARGWRRRGGRREEVDGYRSHTPLLCAPVTWGTLRPTGRSRRTLEREGWQRQTRRGWDARRAIGNLENPVPAGTLRGAHLYSGMRIQDARDVRF